MKIAHVQVAPFDMVDILAEGMPFSLSTSFLSAEFSSSGLLVTITDKDGGRAEARVQFIQYRSRESSRKGDARSGAYLFIPGTTNNYETGKFSTFQKKITFFAIAKIF